MGNKTQKKRVKTKLASVDAVINCTVHADDTARISGYLVNAKTGIRLDLDIAGSTAAKTRSQIEDMEKNLVARLVATYEEQTKVKAKVSLTDKPYTQAYESLTQEEKVKLCPLTWRAETTIKQGLAYFENTMLPLLDRYGLDIDAIQAAKILEEMKQKATQSGNHKGNPLQADNKVNLHAKNFNHLYQQLRMACEDYALPEVELPVVGGLKKIQIEQCKALPVNVVLMFAMASMKCISNGLSMGAIMMLTTMVRTAEACAPKFKDILCFEHYAVYGVLWQGRGNVRVAELKTTAAYRIVVLPKFALETLEKRKQYLRDQGFTDAEIQEMPIVSMPHDPRVAATPNDLSAYVRRFLRLFLHDDQYWETVQQAMLMEPDLEDDKSASTDPAAYALRRNCCSILCNCCGMDPDLVDALMGHKLRPKCAVSWNRWIRRPENWPKIAKMLERFVYDPKYSANPAFEPMVITDGMQYQDSMAEIMHRFFVPPDGEAIEIELSIDACEAGEDITIECDGHDLEILTTAVQSRDNDGGSVLGPVYDLDFYYNVKSTVADMDLTEYQ